MKSWPCQFHPSSDYRWFNLYKELFDCRTCSNLFPLRQVFKLMIFYQSLIGWFKKCNDFATWKPILVTTQIKNNSKWIVETKLKLVSNWKNAVSDAKIDHRGILWWFQVSMDEYSPNTRTLVSNFFTEEFGLATMGTVVAINR